MSTAIAPAIDPKLKPALVDLLYRLADDSLVIGHRNSEWTGIGPILEEDIAFASMAQDKVGHALAFYTLLHELGEPDPDTLTFRREARKFRCCSFVALEVFPESQPPAESLCNNPVRDQLVAQGDWAISLARQFMYSEADALRMSALESSSFDPLAKLARKLRGEIKYHTMHGRTLMKHLARVKDSRDRLQRAINATYGHALGMFEPTQYDAALADANIAPTEASLCKLWNDDLAPFFADVGLALPAKAKPIYGGRTGRHEPEFVRLIENMQKVSRLDPGATW